MNILDILIGLPLLWAIYKGFTKGFVIEIATLLALILGIYGALHFSDFTAEYIQKRFDYESQYMNYISFAITFLVIVIAINIIGRLINTLVEAVALGMVNRLLGVVFGLLKGILIISIVVYLVDYMDRKFDFISDEKKDESLFYKPMEIVSETLFDILDSNFGDENNQLKEKENFLKQI